MPGFYERSTFLSRKKERFTSFETIKTYLTAQGSTFGRAIPLYSIGSDGNDSNIIGHWGYDSNGIIVPMGSIRFDRITDGGHAVIASVTDGTTAVVKTDPVSTLASSGQALAFDLSAGTNLYSGINFSIDGTNLTLPDTTGLAVGDVIYAQGRSEFTWGSGSAFDFHPRENCTSFISGSAKGIYVSGSSYPTRPLKLNCVGSYRQVAFSASLSYNSIAEATSSIGMGWHAENQYYLGLAMSRGGDGIRGAVYAWNAWSGIGAFSLLTNESGFIFEPTAQRADGNHGWAFNGGTIAGSYAHAFSNSFTTTYRINAKAFLLSTEPTIFKLLRC